MTNWYDVAVLGSGAAGLTAALAAAVEGARVAVFEKAHRIGGTTALSGAGIWIPNNKIAKAQGIEDSRELGLAYLASLSNGMILPELAEALIDGGPQLIDFLEANTEIRLQLVQGYPDYHPEHPGGLARGGRTLEPGLVSFEGIEDWTDRIAGDIRRYMLVEMPLGGGTGVIDPETAAERAARKLEGVGRALVGGLLKACLRHSVDIVTDARGLRLIVEDSAVVGVEVDNSSGPEDIRADAVVLATGGFEYDETLVRDFLRGPLTRGVGAPTNTGDGLRMAMRIGAQLGNMREAWWSPVATYPGTRADGGQNTLLVSRERSLPGAIIVNREGRRFANEAANYNAFGGAFHHIDESRLTYPNIPGYLIWDQSVVDRFGVLGMPPGAPVADWVTRAETLDELADAFAIPSDVLRATVERFNEHARQGVDPDFCRGASAYDRFPGGRMLDADSPYSTLGPVGTAPFYGMVLVPSALGTKGGPRTDREGRVLDVDGAVIPGLYAAGNVMASPSGMVYGGAGGTLVVAGVWGLNTGRAAVRDRTAASAP